MADVILEAKIDEAARGLLQTMIKEAVVRALARATADIKKYARDITPVDTGRLRDSFKVFVSGKVIHMLWSTEYAKIADEGATPHTITPRGDYPLKFPGTSQWTAQGAVPSRDGFVRAWKVNHPGYSGHRFSDHMRIVAPQFVREAIIRELQAVRP